MHTHKTITIRQPAQLALVLPPLACEAWHPTEHTCHPVVAPHVSDSWDTGTVGEWVFLPRPNLTASQFGCKMIIASRQRQKPFELLD